jgi:hypothetical protein
MGRGPTVDPMNGTAVRTERRVVRGAPEVVLVGLLALVLLIAFGVGAAGWLASGPRVVADGASGSVMVPVGQVRVLVAPLVATGGTARVESIGLAQPDPNVSVTFAVGSANCPSEFAELPLPTRCGPRPPAGARLLPGESGGISPQALVVEYFLTAPVTSQVPDVVVHYRSGWRTWTKALDISICLTPPSLPHGCPGL